MANSNSNLNYTQQKYTYAERSNEGQYALNSAQQQQPGRQRAQWQQQWDARSTRNTTNNDLQHHQFHNGQGNYYQPSLAQPRYPPPPPPPNYNYPGAAGGYPPYLPPMPMQPPPPPPPSTPIFPSYTAGPGHASSSIPTKAPLPATPPPPPQKPEAITTPKVEDKEVKMKPQILVGKRRGGRVLPTGVVKKVRAEDTTQVKKDPWSQYMNEVKRYKDQSCEEDRKNRPLVK